jgi:hypothetical protein
MAFRDIRKSRKLLSTEEIGLLLLAIFLLTGLLILNVYLARVVPGGEEFYLRWSGARAFLFEEIDPYSATIAERTQMVAYGRPAFSSEYPYVLSDPFYIVLLYTPLALIADFTIARGIWMLFSEAALVALIYSLVRSLEWELPRWLLLSLLAIGIGGFYSLLALRSGTPAVMLVLISFAILYSLRSFSDELAGVLLSLISYQWGVNLLFFLFVIIFVIANKRWKVLAGFGMSLGILLAISFLSYPGWLLPYIRAFLSNWYRSGDLTFSHIIGTWLPDSRISIGLWVTILLGLVVFLEWLGAVNAHYRRVVWVVCLSLAATPLMGFAIFSSNHVVLIPSLILIAMLVWERWTRYRVVFTLLVSGAALLIPFALYFRVLTNYHPIAEDLIRVLPPIAMVIGLYWMRWWAFRTPRTWSDQIGIRK